MSSDLFKQEVCHDWLMQRRAQQDARTPEKMKRNQSLVANGNLSLEEKKRKILRSLRRLEGLGTLKPPDSENQILQMIAKVTRPASISSYSSVLLHYILPASSLPPLHVCKLFYPECTSGLLPACFRKRPYVTARFPTRTSVSNVSTASAEGRSS